MGEFDFLVATTMAEAAQKAVAAVKTMREGG